MHNNQRKNVGGQLLSKTPIELKDYSILTYDLISGNYHLVYSPRYYSNSFLKHKNCKGAGNFQSADEKQRGFYLIGQHGTSKP